MGDTLYIYPSLFLSVGYHLPFQHNKLFHLPYMAVAEINLRISLRVRPEENVPIVEVYHYSITNLMFLLLTVSLL